MVRLQKDLWDPQKILKEIIWKIAELYLMLISHLVDKFQTFSKFWQYIGLKDLIYTSFQQICILGGTKLLLKQKKFHELSIKSFTSS